MHESVHEELQDGVYGPWIVVVCRKNGTKSHGSGGTNGRLRQELRKNANEARISNTKGIFKANDGPVSEAKRKLMPQKNINEAHFA